MAGIQDLMGGMGAVAQPDPQGPSVGGAGCNMERLAALPIKAMYKQKMAEFCSDPANAGACQMLCNTPDEQIVKTFNQVETGLANEISKVQSGQRSELAEGIAQAAPEGGQDLMNLMASPEAGQFANDLMQSQKTSGIGGLAPSEMADVPKPMDTPRGYARGGMVSAGRMGDNNMAHVSNGEMIVPRSVMRDPKMGGGIRSIMSQAGADPERYTVGGRKMSINPVTGEPEFFFALLPMIGGIVGSSMAASAGFAIAGSTLLGGAVAAGLGTAIGSFIETGDLGASLKSGLMGGLTAGAMSGLSNALGGAMATGAEGAATDIMGNVVQNGTGAAPDFLSTTASRGFEAGTALANQSASAVAKSLGTVANAGATGGGLATLNAGNFSGTGIYNSGVTATPAGAGVGAGSAGAGNFTFAGNQIPAGINPIGSAATNQAASKGLMGGVSDWWDGLSGMQKVGIGVGGAVTLAGMMEEPEDPMSTQEQYNASWANSPLNNLNYKGTLAGVDQNQPWLNPTVVYPGQNTQQRPVNYYYTNQNPVPSYARGGSVNGPGTGKSDSIPAYLSDGEFVMTADAVRNAGGGDRRVGAQRLHQLMSYLESRTGIGAQRLYDRLGQSKARA